MFFGTMDWESLFWQTLVMAIILGYILLAFFVFFGIPLLSVGAFVACLVLFFTAPKKSKKKTLWSILSVIAGVACAGIITLATYFIIQLCTTPITFM